jgi:hypothetical protein
MSESCNHGEKIQELMGKMTTGENDVGVRMKVLPQSQSDIDDLIARFDELIKLESEVYTVVSTFDDELATARRVGVILARNVAIRDTLFFRLK